MEHVVVFAKGVKYMSGISGVYSCQGKRGEIHVRVRWSINCQGKRGAICVRVRWSI